MDKKNQTQAGAPGAIARHGQAEARGGESMEAMGGMEAMETLRASELRYRRLFESAQDGILILDAGTGQIEDANPFMQDLLGYSQEEMLGRKLWEIGPARDMAASRAAFAELQRTGFIRYENLPLETKAGRCVEVECVCNAYVAGAQRFIQCNVRDITKRKLAERQLILLDTCVSKLSDIVMLADATSGGEGPGIVFVNKAFQRMTGYTSAEAVGRNPRFLQGANTDPHVVAEIREAVAKRQPIRRKLINYRKDGTEFWVDVDIVPIFDAAGECTHFAAIARDISEAKMTEESLNLFRALMEKSPDAIEVIEPETGRFLDVNETSCRRMGYSRGEMLSLCLGDVIVPGARPFSAPATAAQMRRIGFKTIESRRRRKDGSTFPVEVNIQYIDLDHGYLVAVVRDTTERKQQEAARQATEARYRTLFEYAPDGILIATPENYYLDANASMCAMLGYTHEELVGLHSSDIVAPEEVGRVDEALGEIKTSSDYQCEWKLRRKDGTIFQADVIATSMPDGNLLAMVRDITSRKRSEARFRRLVDSNAQGVLFWNTQGGITMANDAFLRLTGYTRGDLEAGRMDWIAMTPPEHAHLDRRCLEEIAARGFGTPYEKELIRKDGSRVSVLLGAAAFEDNHDEGVSFLVDLTLSKSAEGQIAEQGALLDKAQDAIIVRDLEGKIFFWNKGAERMYGWTRDQVFGRNVCDLYYPDRERFKETNKLVLSMGEWHGDIQHTTRDGRKITVEGRWTLIRDDNGRPISVLTINTDITEKKGIEARFMRAQRMESIGTLAGGIAHDLNNILAPIMMSIEVLKSVSEDPEAQSMLETIEVSARQGAEIVRQVLSFARGVEGARVEVQPKHLLRDLENIIRNTFPKNINLRFSIPNDTWTILGDPTQVHQILLNLCVNARDAMPGGGELKISVGNCVLDEAHAAAMSMQVKAGRYVLISVTDSGTGIPQNILDKIFEPFFTTKDLTKGTGLGLSTVMAVVKSHEGNISVFSEPGKGTTFNVYLPSMEMSPGARKEQEDEQGRPRGNEETVLVVDDEAAILTITRSTLQAYGYRVLIAGNGAEAVALYAQHRHEIALVITDMSMPVMDGPATICALVKINPAVKIIAASGLDANGSTVKGGGAEYKHFLAKPFTAGTLLKTVRATLDER